MEYFRRLPLLISTESASDPSRLTFERLFDKHSKYGLRLRQKLDYVSVFNTQYRLAEADAAEVLGHLPRSLLDIEVPEVWVFNVDSNSDGVPMLSPHRDLVRLCGINVYFETHGERTIFYKYETSDLIEEDSFVAEDGDCFILDVDKPHAVALSPPHMRKMLSISFIRTPYSVVAAHFT